MDDEPLARRNLSSLLALQPDFEVVAECGAAEGALRAVESLVPDLMFLDVQMPGQNGLAVLERVRPMQMPLVIFVTAHDQFAIKAFEAQALDYLLKPFRRERFEVSLDRVRRALIARETPPSSPSDADFMVVKCRDRHAFVRFDSLEFVRAAANYVQLHLDDSTYEVRDRIAVMEERLPADRFMRIHRSYIVNLSAVKELCTAGDGEYMVCLRGGRHLPVGPNYSASVQRVLLEGAGAHNYRPR